MAPELAPPLAQDLLVVAGQAPLVVAELAPPLAQDLLVVLRGQSPSIGR